MQTRLRWGQAESAFGGSLECGVGRSVLCSCVWQESGFSRREDVFTFNWLKREFYKFCTLKSSFKDNAAINCSVVQHKKMLIAVSFDGSGIAMQCIPCIVVWLCQQNIYHISSKCTSRLVRDAKLQVLSWQCFQQAVSRYIFSTAGVTFTDGQLYGFY
jgi:hypothetical protein